MQTGFGGDGSAMAEQYVKSMIDIMTPVMERSMILAAEYSKACGRDTVLPEDMEYAMKYSAMYTVGQDIGSLFPEIYDEEQEDDDEEIVDAIGDMVVVLTNLAHLEGVRIEHCIQSAYDVIKHRNGSMKRGTFVKETK